MSSNKPNNSPLESSKTTMDPHDRGSPAAAVGSVPGPKPSVWEPMLCNEADQGQAPLSLELLYHSAQTVSPTDALVVAVNLLMKETAFVPQGGDLRAAEMPAGWRTNCGVYRLEYSHPLCEGSLVQLIGVSMGPKLLINGMMKVNQICNLVCKLCLDQCSYVSDRQSGESAATAFSNLKELSRLVKDQLAYPLITATREAMMLPVAFGLSVLPPELLLRIFGMLDARSLLRVSSVCRHFNDMANNFLLWRDVFRRDFRDPKPDSPRDTDWKELYKWFYKSRHDHRHLAPTNIFNPVPLLLLPPGIIWGENDQIPNLPPHPRYYDPIGPLQGQRRPRRGRAAAVRQGFI